MGKIALGGGCHWCTEAVFQSLKGVEKVEQGFVKSTGSNDSFSEAVIVHFDAALIGLRDLIEIHLHTHKSTSDHAMRQKYRSAVYTISDGQGDEAQEIIQRLQPEFQEKLITEVLPFIAFKPSEDQFSNYYYQNPQRPFCRQYIQPKLKVLLKRFKDIVNSEKTAFASIEV